MDKKQFTDYVHECERVLAYGSESFLYGPLCESIGKIGDPPIFDADDDDISWWVTAYKNALDGKEFDPRNGENE